MSSGSYVWDLGLSVVGHAKEWYSSHAVGQYALAIILVFWASHIISQLVRLSLMFDCRFRKISPNPRLFSIFFPGLAVWLHTGWNRTNSSSKTVTRYVFSKPLIAVR
jgi:hypothetical protein